MKNLILFYLFYVWKKKGGFYMKFAKGIAVGSLITAGLWMMCMENNMINTKVTRKGKQWMKKMGMM